MSTSQDSNDRIKVVGANIAEKATVIWNVADMLRGPFKPHEYGLVILPIVYYDFGPNNGSVQGGMRPAVVLQNDTRNKQSPTTIVAPLTTELKKLGMYSHIVLGKRFGLKQSSMILLEQLVTVNQASFGDYIGTIDDQNIRHMINVGLRKVLAIQGKPLPRHLKKIEPKPQKKPAYSERDIVCLCHSCRDTYRNLGYKVVYIGGNTDNCSICGYHRGFDHAVIGILTRK